MNTYVPRSFKGSPYSTTKVINYLLSDTTVTKHMIKQERSEKIKATLTDTQQKLKTQSAITSKARQVVMIQNKWEKIVKQAVEIYEHAKALETAAAIVIQRILKGCMVRARYTNYILRIKEVKNSAEIFSLRTQTDMCMLTLGINTVPAILRIQRAYRRYLFYKKVLIFKAAYSLYLEERKKECEAFIKSSFVIFFSKLHRSLLIFIKYRESRLKVIKENLSILTVKKVWKRRKLNIRTLKQKIQRIKRIRIAKQNKEAFEKYLASIGGNLPVQKKEEKTEHPDEENTEKNSLSEENKDRNEEEKIFKESERIQAMIQNRIKYLVEKGKLAHGIPKPRILSAAPVMEHREMGTHRSEVQSKLFDSTFSIIAKSRPASRANPQKRRVFVMNSPKRTNRFEYWHHFESLASLTQPTSEIKEPKSALGSENYLGSTESFTNKIRYLQKSAEPAPRAKKKKVIVKIRFSKKREKDEKNEKKKSQPKWISVTKSTTKYVPGIDNLFYTPPAGTRDTSKQICTNFSVFSTTHHAANFSTLSFNDA